MSDEKNCRNLISNSLMREKSRICSFREIQIIDIFSILARFRGWNSLFVSSLFPSLPQFFPISPRLVDYARRTKLFFSSIGRDYRLLAAKAPRNPPREGEEKSSQAARDSTR